MRVQINEKNEVINFVYGYGYDYIIDRVNNIPELPETDSIKIVKGYAFGMDDEKAKYINDKQLKGAFRYSIDGQGIVHRKEDAVLEQTPEHISAVAKENAYDIARENIKKNKGNIKNLKKEDLDDLIESILSLLGA
jgi:hypothetical protein